MSILTKRVTWKRERRSAHRADLSGKLTREEQENVRTALKAIRLHYGTWVEAEPALKMTHRTVRALVDGRTPQAGHALCVSRALGVGIEDVLSGKLGLDAMLRKLRARGGACPHCGRR